MVRSDSFLPEPTKIQSPKMEGKWGRRGGLMEITHLPLVLPHISVMLIFFFFLLFFFSFSYMFGFIQRTPNFGFFP